MRIPVKNVHVSRDDVDMDKADEATLRNALAVFEDNLRNASVQRDEAARHVIAVNDALARRFPS